MNVIVLRRKRPYVPRSRIEKFYIPRGQCRKNEPALDCAIREFIEETRFVPKHLTIINSFVLWWIDRGIKYTYQIFLGRVRSIFSPQDFLTQGDGDKFNNVLKKYSCRITKYEHDKPILISVADYINKVESLLNEYESSNYKVFFDWILLHDSRTDEV